MNFDFNWFLTTPGMLITGGVLLLIIALIIFIATNGKSKKKENKNIPTPVAQQPVPEQAVAPINDDNANNMPIPEVQETPAIMQDNINPTMAPTTNTNMPLPEVAAVPQNIEVPVTENITGETTAMPNESLAPTVDLPKPPTEQEAYYVEPVVEQQAPVVPEPPIVQSVPQPEVTPTVVQPQVEMPTNLGQQPVSIYGGASPVVNNESVAPTTSHQIYGGANPLEGTQSMPVIDMQNVQTPVSQEPVPTVSVQPQVIEPVAPNVVPTVTPQPYVEQQPVIQPVQPVIEPQPVMPEIVVEQPATPQPNMTQTVVQPVVTPVANGLPGEQIQATAPATSVENINGIQ